MSNQNRKVMKVQAVNGVGSTSGTVEVTYNLAKDSEIDGFGDFFTYEASKQIIGLYWDDLKKKPNNLVHKSELDDRIVAIEIGKEMLMMILSQTGCQGIRFYSGRGVNAETDKMGITIFREKEIGKNTLVAIGMDANGNDLGVALNSGENIANFKNVSIMSEGTFQAEESIKSETNPPLTKGEIESMNFTGRINHKEKLNNVENTHEIANVDKHMVVHSKYMYGLENAFKEYKK